MKQKLRALTSVAIVVCLIFAISVTGFATAKTFPDVTGHWAESNIQALTAKGGVDGFPDGKFHPSENVTLEQFVKIIISLRYGEIQPTNTNWASGYMKKALDINMIEVDDVLASGPMDRLSAVRIIYNALGVIFDEGDEDSDTYALVTTLLDYPTGCSSCRTVFDLEVAQCYAKGIITGKPGPIFDPDALLTRAEACTLIMRMIDKDLRIMPEWPDDDSEAVYYPITPADAKTLMDTNKDILVIDVRVEKDHNAKYIPGSICIPLETLTSGASTKLPANKEAAIIVYCQIGARSTKACEYLAGEGYVTVYHLGGIEDWPYETASK